MKIYWEDKGKICIDKISVYVGFKYKVGIGIFFLMLFINLECFII